MTEKTERADQKVKVGAFEYTMGDSATCPECGKQFICKKHMYMSARWYQIWKQGGLSIGCG
jgi:hypothetical protein